MLESMSAYYEDENPRDPDELIWGEYTDEEWERMTCEERAQAMHSYLENFGI